MPHKKKTKKGKTQKACSKKKKYDIYKTPMIPHATRPPAFPVLCESGCSVKPRSSSSPCKTIARPMMLLAPKSEMTLSENDVETLPAPSARTLPKSPT